MIEQAATAITFEAFFTESKVGKTGLTVTVDVWNHAGVQVVTDGAATETGGGFYRYTLASGSVTGEGGYRAVFKTATATVDLQHVPSYWAIGVAAVEQIDAAISSRSSHSAAGAATAVRSELTTELGRIDAAISSRSTLTAAQANAEADTALADVGLTSTITGRIDAAVSTRSSHSAADTAAAVWAAGTRTLTSFGTLVADIWAAAVDSPGVTTLLLRLGAWTGSGINTVLGALRAMAGKAAALTPTDISTGTTYDNTTDSLEALRDRGDAAWTTGAGGGGGSSQILAAPLDVRVDGDVDDLRIEMYEDDTAPVLLLRVLDADGDALDLTGYTPTIQIGDGAGTVAAGAGTASLAYAEGGIVEYAWDATDTATAATKRLYLKLTSGTSILSAGPVTLEIKARA